MNLLLICRCEEVVRMSDYELLSLVLAISMLVIAIVALCSNAKK